MTGDEKKKPEKGSEIHRLRELVKLNEALDHLREHGVDDETIMRIQSGIGSYDFINSTAAMLAQDADQSGVKNYLSLSLVGFRAPFDRMAIDIIRKGHRTPHEISEAMKETAKNAIAMCDHLLAATTLDAEAQARVVKALDAFKKDVGP